MRRLFEKIKSEPIIAIVIGAFIVRLPLAFYSGPMHMPDERLYHKLAKSIIAGAGYATAKGASLYRPPLYSGFLALVYSVFGPNPIVATLFQAVLSAATCYFVYRIAFSLWGRRTAVLTAVLWAVGPDMIIFSKLLMTETLFLFLAALLLLFLINYPVSLKSSIAIGITAGLAALTRPVILPFLPFALIWMAYTDRANWVKILTIILICAAVITPWTIRNYAVTGHFQLIDATGGINLYAGNHYKGKGEWYFPRGNPLADKSLTEVERDNLAYNLAFRNAYEHPFGTARVIGLKIAYVISPTGEKLYLIKGAAPPAFLWIFLSGFFFEILAFGTTAYFVKKGRTPRTGILWLYVISGIAVLIIAVFGERYRMAAAYPAIIPIAAAGWLYLFEKGETRRKIIALVILVLSQIAAGTYIFLFRPNVVERTIFFLQKLT